MKQGLCAARNCERTAINARGLCDMHYRRDVRARTRRPPRTVGSGNPGIPLTPLAARLRELRLAAETDLLSMAQQLGTYVNRVCDWELGINTPTLPTLQKYARAFGITVSELLSGVM